MLRIKRYIHTLVCPWWLAPSIDNPLRHLAHNPDILFAGLISEGQTVLDIGCGSGYFTIPLARYVGARGQVIAIDLQKKMLELVRQKAIQAGLLARIQLQLEVPSLSDVSGPADFALAFWMLHEVPDPKALLNQVHSLLKPGAGLLIVEPLGHVPAQAFQKTVETTCQAGFRPVRQVKVSLSRAVLFQASGGTP